MFKELNLFEKFFGIVALFALVGFSLFIWAYALGFLFPHSCIIYSAECISYKMETCITNEHTLEQCRAIAGDEHGH